MLFPQVVTYVAVLYSLSGVVLGQQQQLPECAATCLETSLQAQTVCTPTNTTCICTDVSLNAAIQACVGQSCTVKQTMVSLNVTETMCQRPVRDRTYIPTLIASLTGGTALLAVILRTCYAWHAGHFGLDDGCALGAGFFVIPMNAVQLPTGPAGFGRDVWTVTPKNLVLIQKMVWLTQVFYWPISALTKMAFLFFYLRIFPRPELRKYVYMTMALTFVYWAVFQFGNIFYCSPISMVWNGWDGEHSGTCWNINLFMVAASAVNIFIDVLIIALPIRELLNLSLSTKKKMGLLAIFAVGTFTLVVSCLRIKQILSYAKSQNPTWDNVPADYWSVMEANIGVFCVCMPSLRRLLAHHLPPWFGTSKSSRPSDSYSERTPYQSSQRSRKRKDTLQGSLFVDTQMDKTIDVKVTHRGDADDEVELVTVTEQKRTGSEKSVRSSVMAL